MTVLRGPGPAPAWLHRPINARGYRSGSWVRILQCDCGFAYCSPTHKPIPKSCRRCRGRAFMAARAAMRRAA